MLKNKSTQKIKQTGWSSFIADAREELAKAERKVAELRASVRFFEEKERKGEPVPEYLCESSTQN